MRRHDLEWLSDDGFPPVKLEFVYPEGKDLLLEACSLPVRAGRQQGGNSYANIRWKLAEAHFRWGPGSIVYTYRPTMRTARRRDLARQTGPAVIFMVHIVQPPQRRHLHVSSYRVAFHSLTVRARQARKTGANTFSKVVNTRSKSSSCTTTASTQA